MSVIGANRILFMDNYKSVDDLANIVKSMNEEIGISSIKIGLGSPPERTRIIDSLREFSGIIQLVDEHNSGSGSHTKHCHTSCYREKFDSYVREGSAASKYRKPLYF